MPDAADTPATAAPLRFLSFESRRADEIASLIRRHGAEPTVAPSMREVPLSENAQAVRFAEELLAGRFEAVVFLTGVGAEALLDAVRDRIPPDDLFAALNRTTIVVRGPKPTVVLKKWGVKIGLRAPEPNTWRELAETLRGAGDWTGRTIAVQEYGKPNAAFYEDLRSLGASVEAVPVYRWALPEDVEPLEAAIRTAADGGFEIYAFTSAQQIEHVLIVADRLGLSDRLRAAMRDAAIVSIGPTCSEALREAGLPPDLEASPPKMGPMVRTAVEGANEILARKRAKSRGVATPRLQNGDGP